MLDETTCPVCGKELNGTQRLFEDDPVPDGIWAVAHYLAHLVQQKHRPMSEASERMLVDAAEILRRERVDKKKNLPR